LKKGQRKIASCDTAQQQEGIKREKEDLEWGNLLPHRPVVQSRNPCSSLSLTQWPLSLSISSLPPFYFYIRIVNLDHFVMDTAAVEEPAQDSAKNAYFILRAMF
jgi:hypothetical protein